MASIKNYFLYTLIAASSISLTACGGGSSGTGSTGGGSGGSGTTTSDITFSGQIYDAAIPNAEIEIYAGDKDNGGKLLGTVTADIDGNYSLKLSLSSDDNDKPLIIHATSGTTKLVSIADDIGDIVSKARTVGGKKVLSSSDSAGLNVTNVTTANFALIKNKHGGVPTSKSALEQVENTIKSDTTLQAQVLQAAAAIKAVIDQSGVSLPTGFDTEKLVVAVIAALVDSATNEGSTFLTTHSTEIDSEKANIQNDDKLASQFISGGIKLTDLSGNTFAFSESDALVWFVDDSTLKIYSYDTNISNANGGFDVEENGTYTFDETAQTLSIAMNNGENVSVKILGGSSNIFAVEVKGTETERGKMLKVTDAASISAPFAVFDTDHSRGLMLTGACNDITATMIIGDSSGGEKVTCKITNKSWVINNSNGPKSIIIPVAGTSTNRVNYVAWSYDNNDIEVEKGAAFTTEDASIGDVGDIKFQSFKNGKKILSILGSSTNATTGTADQRTSVGQKKDGTLINENTKFLDAIAVNANPYASSAGISVNDTQGDNATGVTILKIKQPTSDTAVIHSVVIDDKGSNPTYSIQTRKSIMTSLLSASDISDKTFEWKDTENGDEGTIQFTANGDANITEADGTQNNNTWMADSNNQVIIKNSDNSYSKLYKLDVDLGSNRFIIVSEDYTSSDVFDGLSKFVVKEQ